MRIFVNRKTKTLFLEMSACVLVFALFSMAFLYFKKENAALYIEISSLVMAAFMIFACYRYVKAQHRIIEGAKTQIAEYIAGNKEVRIACNEEGELYRLFHEVNSLAAILNARAQNELRTKEFLRDTISDISHQLKTPLAALNIYNGILKEEAENLPTIQEFNDLSEKELERMETLVQNLLKITKLDAGTIVIDKTREDIADMMESVRERFLFRAGSEGKEIRLEGEKGVSLFCDRIWIMEAVENIVKNALDHTKSGDVILITWKRIEATIQLSIKDNGSGIHPEDLYHIFKRFYRSRFSKDKQGVGLGLALSKAIIEAHDGTIQVDSDLGAGAAFVIHFSIPTNL